MGSILYHFVIRFVGFWEKIFAGFDHPLPLLISGGGYPPEWSRSRMVALFRMIINYTNI